MPVLFRAAGGGVGYLVCSIVCRGVCLPLRRKLSYTHPSRRRELTHAPRVEFVLLQPVFSARSGNVFLPATELTSGQSAPSKTQGNESPPREVDTSPRGRARRGTTNGQGPSQKFDGRSFTEPLAWSGTARRCILITSRSIGRCMAARSRKGIMRFHPCLSTSRLSVQ